MDVHAFVKARHKKITPYVMLVAHSTILEAEYIYRNHEGLWIF